MFHVKHLSIIGEYQIKMILPVIKIILPKQKSEKQLFYVKRKNVSRETFYMELWEIRCYNRTSNSGIYEKV